jgi:hypothetical protein
MPIGDWWHLRFAPIWAWRSTTWSVVPVIPRTRRVWTPRRVIVTVVPAPTNSWKFKFLNIDGMQGTKGALYQKHIIPSKYKKVKSSANQILYNWTVINSNCTVTLLSQDNLNYKARYQFFYLSHINKSYPLCSKHAMCNALRCWLNRISSLENNSFPQVS